MIKLIQRLIFIILLGNFQLGAMNVARVFSDNMVLQQGVEVPVWGEGINGEEIRVTFNTDEVKTVVTDGRWMLTLPPQQAGGPYELHISGFYREIVFQNVMVGEVWLASGQSNMVWSLKKSADAQAEIENALHPDIRLYHVPREWLPDQTTKAQHQWNICAPETVENFSAVAYYFARNLYQSLKVPVGIIAAAYGGTSAQSWVDLNVLEANPDYHYYLHRYREAMRDYPEKMTQYEKKLQLYNQLTAVEKKRKGTKPQLPMGPVHPKRPAALYKYMITPLQPFAIKGIIWYQGESDRHHAFLYRKLFADLIKLWRKDWQRWELPFLFTQLAPCGDVDKDTTGLLWPELMESQHVVSKTVTNTGMAVIVDQGDANSIHPLDKEPVGHRLSLLALNQVYDQDIHGRSPVFLAKSVKKDKIYIKFADVGGGLTVKGEKLNGFTIKGMRNGWRNAKANVLDDHTVVVWDDTLQNPVDLRYGWSNFPTPPANLFSKSGLPVGPFRTDSLKLITQKDYTKYHHSEPQKPRVFLLDPETLYGNREKIFEGDKILLSELRGLRQEADDALGLGPFSVMQKAFIPPSGDKHDYMSMGPYWWPDPNSENGLPYIRRDGEVNPERNQYDRIPLGMLDSAVVVLSLAYYFTKHEPYAKHAIDLIQTWFINDDTRMNPNLKFGQGIPGKSTGRGTGIIEARAFFRITESIGLLASSPIWTGEDRNKINYWFNQFLNWLLNSEIGLDERERKNNHGTWYDVTTSTLALFLNDIELAKEILAQVPLKRISVQIEPDGRQLLELKRTRAFHYSAMNLEGLFHAAILGEKVGLDLWNFSTEDGRSLRSALDFLIPYALQDKKWPYPQLRGWEGDLPLMHFLLRLAAINYKEPAYEEVISKLPGLEWSSRFMELLYPR